MKTRQISIRLEAAELAILKSLSAHTGTKRTAILRALIKAATDEFRRAGQVTIPFKIEGGRA